MYIEKSDGSSTDTWGTPKVTVDISELKPLIETDCFRSVKYDSNYLFDMLTFQHFNFDPFFELI